MYQTFVTMASMYPSVLLLGNITPEKTKILVNTIEKIAETNTTIGIRFQTTGGNLKGFHDAEKHLTQFKEKGITLIGEAREVGSAGLLIYLLCDRRLIVPAGYGFIHLPEPNKKGVAPTRTKQVQQDCTDFIKEHTLLNEEKIRSLNNQIMGSTEMIKHGIAHEKVFVFESKLYS